jgi:hypothetical protein
MLLADVTQQLASVTGWHFPLMDIQRRRERRANNGDCYCEPHAVGADRLGQRAGHAAGQPVEVPFPARGDRSEYDKRDGCYERPDLHVQNVSCPNFTAKVSDVRECSAMPPEASDRETYSPLTRLRRNCSSSTARSTTPIASVVMAA